MPAPWRRGISDAVALAPWLTRPGWCGGFFGRCV